MSHHSLPGEPPVQVLLRRSKRARRISLRVSQLDGRVTLTLPNGVSEKEALDFAHEKAGWVRGHLLRQPERRVVSFGQCIPVEGKSRVIVPTRSRRVVLTETELLVPDRDSSGPGRRLQAFLKELARDRLTQASDSYAEKLGRAYTRITMRDTRSRWGSCSSKGGLMYSWRLILAPPDVLQYVAAHEVAHLAEMNHSPAFWRVVECLYGPFADQRAWLKREGTQLHRYAF